jgi:hypothetical protein
MPKNKIFGNIAVIAIEKYRLTINVVNGPVGKVRLSFSGSTSLQEFNSFGCGEIIGIGCRNTVLEFKVNEINKEIFR